MEEREIHETKSARREARRKKRRKMRVSGRGVRTLQEIIRRRAEKVRKEEGESK